MSTRGSSAYALGGVAFGIALGLGVALLALRSDPAPAPAFDPAISGERIGPRLGEILNREDPLQRVTELGALLSTLGPGAVPSVVEAFEAAPLDAGDPEFVLLGIWWVRLDAQATLAWIATDWRAQSGGVIAAVFRGWGHIDPPAALANARGLGLYLPSQLAEFAIDGAIFGWDASGKPGLVEVITQLSDMDMQRLAGSLARRRVVTLGPAGAFDWVESLGAQPRFQQVVGERVASSAALSGEGAPLAAAWATPRVRSDERLSNFPRRIATRWASHDPEAAMAWLATLPAGADRDDGVSEAFRTWLGRDRSGAFAWLDGSEIQRWKEPALGLQARTLSGEDPKRAIELAQRISDPQLQETTLVLVSRKWLKQDRAAAEAWLAQPGLPERVRLQASRTREPRAGARRARAEGNPTRRLPERED